MINKETYESARKRFGLKDSKFIDGREYAYIPTDPAALLAWAFDRLATPIFGDDGELIDWRLADAETVAKYRIIVEETARANGYEFRGLDPFFE